MMLPILFAGCLALCAATTTFIPPDSTTAAETSTPTPFTQPLQATVPYPTDSDNIVAILLAAVKSTQELNETDIGQVLNQVQEFIKKGYPGVPNFSLTLQSITRVGNLNS